MVGVGHLSLSPWHEYTWRMAGHVRGPFSGTGWRVPGASLDSGSVGCRVSGVVLSGFQSGFITSLFCDLGQVTCDNGPQLRLSSEWEREHLGEESALASPGTVSARQWLKYFSFSITTNFVLVVLVIESGYCYGLRIPVSRPPIFPCGLLTPSVMVCGGGAFGR